MLVLSHLGLDNDIHILEVDGHSQNHWYQEKDIGPNYLDQLFERELVEFKALSLDSHKRQEDVEEVYKPFELHVLNDLRCEVDLE